MKATFRVGSDEKVRFSLEEMSFADFFDVLVMAGEYINRLERKDPRYRSVTKRFDPAFQVMELALENHRDKFPLESGGLEQATGSVRLFNYLNDLKVYNNARKAQADKL